MTIFSSYISKFNIIPDVIILTETRFSEGNTDNNTGYVPFISGRPEKSGGGVSVFLNNNLDCRKTEIKKMCQQKALSLSM